MNAFLTTRRRSAAAALASTALLIGSAGAVIAPAQAGAAGISGMPASGQTGTGAAGLLGLLGGTGASGTTGLGGLGSATSGLPFAGLLKALIAVFGAVHAQVPTIAAPIIAQGVTAGTITQAEAAQLTTLLSEQLPMEGAGLGSSAGIGSGMGSGAGMGPGMTFTKPSAGEITVLHKVIAAVLGALPTIAGPVLATEVTNGDITQAESAMFTKIISGLASMASGLGTGSPTPGLTGSALSGNLMTSLSTKVAASVKKPTKHHHHKKASTSTRSHHSR